jgi:hypothetical protein
LQDYDGYDDLSRMTDEQQARIESMEEIKTVPWFGGNI